MEACFIEAEGDTNFIINWHEYQQRFEYRMRLAFTNMGEQKAW